MDTKLDGIINFHKPVRITSARALYRVRGVTGQRKSGHAGTLDPGASGVLVLCLGRATKLVERVMDQPKVYRATARLDITSESFDMDRPARPVDVTEIPLRDRVVEACSAFEGEIEQMPPQISAVKVDGQPAYKRRGSEQPIELKARSVRVYWLVVHAYEWPTLDFEMCCGRGTYVRGLIRDLGVALGTGGCLTALERTHVGPFAVTDAWTHQAIEERRDSMDWLIPLEQARELLSPENSPPPPDRSIPGAAAEPSS